MADSLISGAGTVAQTTQAGTSAIIRRFFRLKLSSRISIRISTSADTVNVAGFSSTDSLEYARLAAAFAYELGA